MSVSIVNDVITISEILELTLAYWIKDKLYISYPNSGNSIYM